MVHLQALIPWSCATAMYLRSAWDIGIQGSGSMVLGYRVFGFGSMVVGLKDPENRGVPC